MEGLKQAHSMTQHKVDSWQETPEWKTHQEEMTRMGLTQMEANFGQFMHQMAVFHQQRTAAMNQQCRNSKLDSRHKPIKSRALGTS